MQEIIFPNNHLFGGLASLVGKTTRLLVSRQPTFNSHRKTMRLRQVYKDWWPVIPVCEHHQAKFTSPLSHTTIIIFSVLLISYMPFSESTQHHDLSSSCTHKFYALLSIHPPSSSVILLYS
ncbi:hypothetical protein BsWGS_14971 [Bradybaena similaris]